MSPQRPAQSRREFLVAGLLVSAAAAGWALSAGPARRRPSLGSLDTIVPEQIGAWRTAPDRDLEIPRGEEPEDRGFDQLLTRLCAAPGRSPITLLIAYSPVQAGNTVIHRPEDCYPASGFSFAREADRVIVTASGLRRRMQAFSATGPGRAEEGLYCTRVGTEFPPDGLHQRLSMLRQAGLDGPPDGALIRISTINADRPMALADLTEFTRTLLSIRSPRLEALLNG